MPLYSEAAGGALDDDFYDEGGGADPGYEVSQMLKQSGDTAEAVHEEALRKLLLSLDEIQSDPEAAEGSLVQRFLMVSTEWNELFGLWETYHSRRGSAALSNAVHVMARLIEVCTSARLPSGDILRSSDSTTRHTAPLAAFAPSAVAVCRVIIQRQLRAVYPWLGSDDQRLILGSMRLLAAIAWCSAGIARELQTGFNWGLKVTHTHTISSTLPHPLYSISHPQIRSTT